MVLFRTLNLKVLLPWHKARPILPSRMPVPVPEVPRPWRDGVKIDVDGSRDDKTNKYAIEQARFGRN